MKNKIIDLEFYQFCNESAHVYDNLAGKGEKTKPYDMYLDGINTAPYKPEKKNKPEGQTVTATKRANVLPIRR